MPNDQSPGASGVNDPAKRSGPSVASGLSCHRFAPGALTLSAATECVVAVLEDRRVHVDAVADDRAGRKAAAVDDRLDRLDLDAGRRVVCPG